MYNAFDLNICSRFKYFTFNILNGLLWSPNINLTYLDIYVYLFLLCLISNGANSRLCSSTSVLCQG